MVVYNNYVRYNWTLSEYTTIEALTTAIKALPYTTGLTNTSRFVVVVQWSREMISLQCID